MYIYLIIAQITTIFNGLFFSYIKTIVESATKKDTEKLYPLFR